MMLKVLKLDLKIISVMVAVSNDSKLTEPDRIDIDFNELKAMKDRYYLSYLLETTFQFLLFGYYEWHTTPY